MASRGRVREWHPDEGWGVVDSPDTPGGCWASFSHVTSADFYVPSAGDAVWLEWEAADQDGFDVRARRLWQVDSEPIDAWPAPDDDAILSRIRVRKAAAGTSLTTRDILEARDAERR